MKKSLFFPMTILYIISLLKTCQQEVNARFEMKTWGKSSDTENVNLYTLENSRGARMQVTNYGAIIVSLTMPDKNGKYEDIVLGYDNLEDYLKVNPYFGAIVGRFGNRIAFGKFSIGETEYQVPVNSGENHLHGGFEGFDKVLWSAREKPVDRGVAIELIYNSPDGEMGYPGNFTLMVTYTLTDDNELIIDYQGSTDQATIVNPTHHSYFNLTGNYGTILNHRLMINAEQYTPVNNLLIPTGEIAPVDGTPMDFRKAKEIGRDIQLDFEQLTFGFGYDHNWVLSGKLGKMKLAATLFEPVSGRLMEVFTTEPGIQFYSGNFLDGTITGKYDVIYNYRDGLCLEAQHFPDSPNKPDFPSVVLNPGEIYTQKTVYKFSTR
ncbi:MAG: galactose mutarotase [Candidatus Marinimicrobia bacterium]|nr:galactose mutarotase [Candidatus Neomarinimicrobiota bacterium]